MLTTRISLRYFASMRTWLLCRECSFDCLAGNDISVLGLFALELRSLSRWILGLGYTQNGPRLGKGGCEVLGRVLGPVLIEP
jgi:hypothetical protein